MSFQNERDFKELLSGEGFTFKKSLGQNFIIDPFVCPKMAEFAADCETGVIEIGPGAGVLTRSLSETAKKVVAVEIDERLKPVLKKSLEGCDNVKVIFGDILKTDINKLISEEFAGFEKVNICANLPYYITSSIIMGILKMKPDIGSLTAMVQKEAAQRICAEVGSRNAGAVTVAVDYYSEASVLFEVSRNCFMPAPKVDSAVINLRIRKEPKVEVKSEEFFFKVAKSLFAQRRKTLLNSVSSTLKIDKSVISSALKNMGLDESIRGEKLTIGQIAEFSNLIN